MILYEAWKERRNQTQALPVKKLSDCSREDIGGVIVLYELYNDL